MSEFKIVISKENRNFGPTSMLCRIITQAPHMAYAWKLSRDLSTPDAEKLAVSELKLKMIEAIINAEVTYE